MADRAPRYSFHPLERRGVLLGLQPVQVATLLAGLFAAWIVAGALPTPAAPVAAGVVLAGAAGAALWSVQGRPAGVWAAVAVAWAARRVGGPLCSTDPLQGHGRSAPAAGRRVPSKAFRGRDCAPAGVGVLELAALPGQPAVGVFSDSRAGMWAGVMPVGGRSFSLLDPDEQARRLDAWRVALNSLGRPGTAVKRVQWVERSAPGDAADLIEVAATLGGRATVPVAAVDSYRAVVAGAGPATQLHDVWVVVAVAGPTSGRGPAARRAAEALRRELRLLEGQLRNADLLPSVPLNAAGLVSLVRAAGEPGAPRGLRDATRSLWSMADDEGWSALRSDGSWHATYWVAEWPRVEVGPDFLAPLLLCAGTRTVSLTMAPVPPERAAREVRSARTADVADEQLRARAGFLPSARRGREAEAVVLREEELAEGHAEYRFSGYVTVSATDRAGLQAACAETEHAAQAAHLEIRRLYGRQREAFTWTLPLARGLR